MIRAVVVMGVSGCGKSTLGRALAERLGWAFVEGDDQHPPANIAKMAAGIPLTDADRAPFLANVAAAMAAVVELRSSNSRCKTEPSSQRKLGSQEETSALDTHETPAFGHPAKYYFAGTRAGVTKKDRQDQGVVATCSALKYSYRQLIRDRVGPVAFVMPELDEAMLRARMRHREGHFMPAALLDSQLASLERPGAGENAIFVDGASPVADQVECVIAALERMPAA